MNRMSKPFYMISFLGVIIFPVIFGIIFRVLGMDIDEYRQPLMAAVLVYMVIIYLFFVWRIWTALQDGSARNTPLKASLFLLIPIFNIYWVFEAGRHHWLVEVGLFYAVSGISVAIGTGLMGWLIKRYGVRTTYAFVSNIVTAVLINYAARKFFIFKG